MTHVEMQVKYKIMREQLGAIQLDAFMELYAFDRLGINRFEDTLNSLTEDMVDFKNQFDKETELIAKLIENKNSLKLNEPFDIQDVWDFLEKYWNPFEEEIFAFRDNALFLKYEERIQTSEEANEQLTLNLLALLVQNNFINMYAVSTLCDIPFEEMMLHFKDGLLFMKSEVETGLLTKDIAEYFDKEVDEFNQMKETSTLSKTGDKIYMVSFHILNQYSDILDEMLTVYYSNMNRLSLLLNIEEMVSLDDMSALKKDDIIHYIAHEKREFSLEKGTLKEDNHYSDGVEVHGDGWEQYVSKLFIRKVERNGRVIFESQN